MAPCQPLQQKQYYAAIRIDSGHLFRNMDLMGSNKVQIGMIHLPEGFDNSPPSMRVPVKLN